MRARLFGLFLVACLINPFMHAHYALSDSPNPAEEPPNPVRVEIEPKSISVLNQKYTKFKATAYNKDGSIEDRIKFTWKVDNPNLGTIKDGIFYSKTFEGQGKISVGYKDLLAYADVKVSIESLNVSVSKETADFGEVEWDQEKIITITVRNNSATNATIRLSDPHGNKWYIAHLHTPLPINKNRLAFISISIDCKKIKTRVIKESNFDIIWTGIDVTGKTIESGKITIPIKVKVVPPKCTKFVPLSLELGKVSRGQKKTMSFAVVFASQRNVKGSFELDVPWLSVTPKEFTTKYENLPADQVKLTLDTKKLPKGSYHEGHVTVKSDMCEDAKLGVYVNTEEKVTSTISIGKKEGTVNGNKVTFAHPPIVKNNKTYMTPEIIEKIFFAQTKIEGEKLEIIWQSKKVLGKVVTINGVQYADLSIRYFTETIGASVSYSAKDKSTTFVWTPE